MNAFFKKAYLQIKGFMNQLSDDHVNAYAAQSSFFIIISMFPLVMLVFYLIKYTPITKDFLIAWTEKAMPTTLEPLANTIINEMFEKSSGTILSLTAIFALWSASKGILAIIRGLNNIFKINEHRGYFHLRFISAIYTLIFVVGIVLSLVMMVYGNLLLKFFDKHMPLLYDLAKWIIDMRWLYLPILLTLLFIGLYKLVQNSNYSTLGHLPGAIFSAFGWYIFSFFYSIYIDNFAGQSYAYGSLTTVVLMMLWIYVCIYILFIGAEINIYFRKSLIMLRYILSKKKQQKRKSFKN